MKKLIKVLLLLLFGLLMLALTGSYAMTTRAMTTGGTRFQSRDVLQAGAEYWRITNNSDNALPFRLSLYPKNEDPVVLYPCNQNAWGRLFTGPSFVPPHGYVYAYSFESDGDNSDTRAVLENGSGCVQESYWGFKYSDHISLADSHVANGYLIMTIFADYSLPTKGLAQIQVAQLMNGQVVALHSTGVGDISLLKAGETAYQRINLNRYPVDFDAYEIVVVGLETLETTE